MRIPAALREEMLAHLKACLPEEGCGVLGGWQGRCSRIFPVGNELHSPEGFRMNSREQVRAFHQLDEQGLELLAIFHSHPHGPQVPSSADVDDFAYPGVASLICVPQDGEWIVRGFQICADRVTEIDLIWE